MLLERFSGGGRIVAPKRADGLPDLFTRTLFLEVHGGALRAVRRQPLAQRLRIVRVNTGVVGSSGDGYVGEPGVDEIARGIGVDVGENAASSEALRTVRSHSVAVVELPKLHCIEGHGALGFACLLYTSPS